jgi:tRNA dimethylallyltransferase
LGENAGVLETANDFQAILRMLFVWRRLPANEKTTISVSSGVSVVSPYFGLSSRSSMDDHRQKLVVIAGPTASGKSALAVELARHFKGEIVNADSMQVYRGMDIGTAKPTSTERGNILHHLLDVVDPDEEFNAAIYRSLTLPVVKDIHSRHKLSLVVGGTGLYIKTLLGGLLNCPPNDPAIRAALDREWEESGPQALYKRLEMLDPDSARRIHPNDRVRIVRALEIIRLTNGRLSSLVREHGFKNRPFRALKICLQIDREGLYHRIDERCLGMIEKGLAGETENLLNKGYTQDLKPMKSLGYRHMLKYLEGDWDLDKAIDRLQRDTRRYAKRQLTWFRADPEMLWMRPENANGIINRIVEFI